MKTHFALGSVVISLTLNFLHCNGQGNYAHMAVGVAKAMVGLFSKDEEETRDLTEADELVRGLTFDLYDEKISCRVMAGILLKDYPTVIENFARRYSIPGEVKDSLLDAQFSDDFVEVVQNFKFEIGKTGTFVYGRIATMKRGDKIDMASAVYTLDFKLSPKVIEHKKKKKFLWFTTGTKVWRETKERNFSIKEKDKLQEHLKIKAISKFRSEYANLVEATSTEAWHNEL